MMWVNTSSFKFWMKKGTINHLQKLVFLSSPLVPLIDNPPPQDPSVFFQMGQVGRCRWARYQRGATIPPRSTHWAHGFGICFKQPECNTKHWDHNSAAKWLKSWAATQKEVGSNFVREIKPIVLFKGSESVRLFLKELIALFSKDTLHWSVTVTVKKVEVTVKTFTF